MGDFLAFRRMITPILIQFLFWLGVIGCVIGGLITMVAAEGGQKALGLLILLGGPLVVRIYCEIFILFFRMNETLTDIRNNTNPQGMPR